VGEEGGEEGLRAVTGEGLQVGFEVGGVALLVYWVEVCDQ
jgi:hypothetical protein